MPEMTPYQQRYLPDQLIQGRAASPEDFGASIGRAVGDIGDTLGRAADQYAAQEYEHTRTEELTAAHTIMAERQAHWTQEYQARIRTASPGDDTFAPLLMNDVAKDLGQIGENFKTEEGKSLWARLSANMAENFHGHAIAGQAHLTGAWAKVQNDQLNKSLGSIAYADPSQADALIKQASDAIDAPDSVYAKVDKSVRDTFKAQAANQIRFAAMSRTAQNQPLEIVQHISPELAAEYGELNDQPAPPAKPVGIPKVSPGAARWSSQANTAAANSGVKPNILLAQIDQESGGNPNAINKGDIRVTGSPSVGIAQFQPRTAQRYGIDPTKPDQAIQGQAKYMADLLKMFNGDYTKALAGYNWGEGNVQSAVAKFGGEWFNHAPGTTQNYVKSILSKAGMDEKPIMVTGPGASAAQVYAADRAPASVDSLPGFSELSWEQQQHIVGTAQTALRAQATAAERARQAAARAKADQQEQVMSGFTDRIFTPSQNAPWPTDEEITSNSTLDHKQKHELFSMMAARTNELSQRAENKLHPEAQIALEKRITQLPDSDPNKIWDESPLNDAYYAGNISAKERDYLVKILKDPDKPLQKSLGGFVRDMDTAYAKNFEAGMAGSFNTQAYIEGQARFHTDFQAAVDAKKAAKEDPRDLIDPANKDFFFKKHPFSTYYPKATDVMASAAEGVKAGTSAPLVEQQASTRFTAGEVYTINGKQMKYLGGPENAASSWGNP